MNKIEIENILKKYNFDKKNYMVISGAALVLLGIKDSTNDIDISVTKEYYDNLLKKYDCKLECIFNNINVYFIDNIINFSTNYYNEDDIISVNDIPVQKIESIKNLKLNLNKKKDIEDLNLIDKYLNLNGLAMAYLGDSVYEVYIRKYLISEGNVKVDDLQKKSIKYVSAKGQANILNNLIDNNKLTEEEIQIVKKGRNTKSHKAPKNTDIVTYKYATGFETLVGYLYLFNKTRLEDLMKEIIGE